MLQKKILRPKLIGEKAVKKVIQFEKTRGWKAQISFDKNSGYDVISVNLKNKSQYRCIEVKGKLGQNFGAINLYIKLKQKLGKDKKNYYIYIVQNIEKHKPKVKIISPKLIFKHLKIKKILVLEPKYYKKYLV